MGRPRTLSAAEVRRGHQHTTELPWWCQETHVGYDALQVLRRGGERDGQYDGHGQVEGELGHLTPGGSVGACRRTFNTRLQASLAHTVSPLVTLLRLRVAAPSEKQAA